jgi:hypothetical protein
VRRVYGPIRGGEGAPKTGNGIKHAEGTNGISHITEKSRAAKKQTHFLTGILPHASVSREKIQGTASQSHSFLLLCLRECTERHDSRTNFL